MRRIKQQTADFSTQRPFAPVGVWRFSISLYAILITILDFVVFFRASLYLYLNLTKSATTLRRPRCGEINFLFIVMQIICRTFRQQEDSYFLFYSLQFDTEMRD